jgi:hypothetical protein
MIVRDQWGIIIQHPVSKSSGGDSARSTGLMALFGSTEDLNLIKEFEVPKGSGLLTRHPWDYTDDCFTRDQALPLIAGLWAAKEFEITKRVFWSHAKRGFFCQNYRTQFTRVNKGFFGRDPLSPSHIGHLILCAKMYWLYPILPFCYLWLFFDILWATKVKPDMEQNQLISMLVVYDMLWLWAWLHPAWQKPILSYWCGWRDQCQIAEFMIKGIERKLYPLKD